MRGISQFPSGSDNGRGSHHHHDRAVLADDGDVGPGPEGVVGRAEQLGPDEHGEQAAGEEEQQDADGVLHPDDLVVVGHAEVAHPALLRGSRRELVPEHLGQGVIQGTDAGHPTEDPQGEPEHDGDVVLPRALDVLVAAGDDVAQPVPDEVADDATGHGPEDIGTQPVRAPPDPGSRSGVPSSSSPGYSNSPTVVSMAMAGFPLVESRADTEFRSEAHVSCPSPWSRRTSPPWNRGRRCRGSSHRLRRSRRACRSAR